jgi:hypothetical protein
MAVFLVNILHYPYMIIEFHTCPICPISPKIKDISANDLANVETVCYNRLKPTQSCERLTAVSTVEPEKGIKLGQWFQPSI